MLVDTSVWIDFFNGAVSAKADRLHRAIADGEAIALSGVVFTEILAGLKTDADAKSIAEVLTAFDWVAEFGINDYAAAARIYRVCRTKGFAIRSMVDCLIAQACLRDELPLLSKDRDFESIARSFPLRLVVD